MVKRIWQTGPRWAWVNEGGQRAWLSWENPQRCGGVRVPPHRGRGQLAKQKLALFPGPWASPSPMWRQGKYSGIQVSLGSSWAGADRATRLAQKVLEGWGVQLGVRAGDSLPPRFLGREALLISEAWSSENQRLELRKVFTACSAPPCPRGGWPRLVTFTC